MKRKCPKCKSENIILALGGITGKYKCKNCNYTSPLVIEKNGEIEPKMKKDLKRIKKEVS